jgi:hypothetical protein
MPLSQRDRLPMRHNIVPQNQENVEWSFFSSLAGAGGAIAALGRGGGPRGRRLSPEAPLLSSWVSDEEEEE